MKSSIKRFFAVGLAIVLALSSIAAAPASVSAKKTPSAIPMVIDADTGVDDAAAIAYLLTRSDLVNILGITSVAGNTTVDNAANNALILLDTAQRTNIPVVVGAASPLTLAPSQQGMFVHGPDGFWFTSYNFPAHDVSALSHDAAGFLCSKAAAGVTLLALGPLTNIANAVQTCPEQMKLYNIIWMGGAKSVEGEGNTPVSVFNAWYDPDAASIVLQAGLTITLVTSDAARTATIDPTIFDKLASKGNALGKLIAPSLKQYASLFAQPTGRHGKLRVAMFDPATAVLAAHPDWITSQTALVTVQTGDGITRGETILGFSLGDHVSMLASDAELSAIAVQLYSDPNFDLYGTLGSILARQPDNAKVVLTLDPNQVMKEWLTGVTK